MPRRLFLTALLSFALAAPAAAATILVNVVDENGTPVVRPRLFLQEGGKINALGDPFRRSRVVEGNANGHAQFDDLQPGLYVLGARTIEMRLDKDEDNPLAPRVQLTIDSPDQVVEIRLELHQGTQLCTRFVIDGSRLDARGSLSRTELESGYSIERRLRREEELCEPLFAGRWELRLEPPGGYVLVDLDVNGVSTSGNSALLDVRPGSRAQNVTWYLAALARLEGQVYYEGERFDVLIRAELLQAGEWLTQAEARGGSLYAPVQTRPDPRDGNRYAVDLPDGRWRIRPVGEDLEEADPAVVEVDIARGEQFRQDFTLRGEPSDDLPWLAVRVKSPIGERVTDAVVEVWPAEPDARGELPLAAERTERWGTARFKNLQPGGYRLVAGHPGYYESARTIVFDPEEEDSRLQTIRLRRAAELSVRILPDEERDVAGGTIVLTRNDEPLTTELTDERLLDVLRQPRAELDATDRAWVPGIYAGTYRVTGLHDRLFFEFKQNGRWIEEPEVTFANGETRELEARIAPAATIAGRLYCVGGEPLPGKAEVRVVPAETILGDPLDLAWQQETVLTRQALLDGEDHDAFDVGPLAPSEYYVAVRPATFDRWTWAYGTENGAEGESFRAERGETIQAGVIAVDCEPAVRATVAVGSGGDAPDLGATRWDRDLQLQATVVTQEGRRYELDTADLDRYARLLMLRGFREGDVTGEISLRHDHFVPDPWVRVPVSGELLRGRTLDVVMTTDDVGGALVLNVAAPDGAVARLVDPQGVERSAPLEDGRVSIPNLAIGKYEMWLCGDTLCTTWLREPEAIEIEPLRTLELRRALVDP